MKNKNRIVRKKLTVSLQLVKKNVGGSKKKLYIIIQVKQNCTAWKGALHKWVLIDKEVTFLAKHPS